MRDDYLLFVVSSHMFEDVLLAISHRAAMLMAFIEIEWNRNTIFHLLVKSSILEIIVSLILNFVSFQMIFESPGVFFIYF